MAVKFECPYCGEMFSEADDIDYIRSYKACSECGANFDDDELDELLPEEDDEDDEDDFGADEDYSEDDDDFGSGDDDYDEDAEDDDFDEDED